ncbi:MAG: hypothetical protein HUJ55_01760 [Ileibacterium sp.]|nr:hypothetical protein [Ileibacterium sp.]
MKFKILAWALMAVMTAGSVTFVRAAQNEDTADSPAASILQNLKIDIMFSQDTAAKTSDGLDDHIHHDIKKYTKGTLLQVTVTGLSKVRIGDEIVYVNSSSYVSGGDAVQKLEQKRAEEEKKAQQQKVKAEEEKKAAAAKAKWDGPVLSMSAGTIEGPSGKETYYNLPMDGVVENMRQMGNQDEYWVREDGVKMLGEYVMVAANYSIRPKGSKIETSLGTGIVVDTGGFAAYNPTQLDIAVEW